MKRLKPLFLILLTLALVSCGTNSNYTQNNLNKNFYNGKTIYFMYGYDSKDFISYKGMHASVLGPDLPPDVKKVFRESIEELATETKLNLKVADNLDNINDPSAVLVYVNIKEILWSFGFSVATLKTDVKYTIKPSYKEYNTIGIRKSGGGDPSNNVRKSLKVATYNFLKELEK